MLGEHWVKRVFMTFVILGWSMCNVYSTNSNLMMLTQDIDTHLTEIQKTFDAAYPTELALPPGTELTKQRVQNIHDKRCFLQENAQAVEQLITTLNMNMESGRLSLPVLAATPCLGFDSMGNNLAAYFENIVCANLVGLHYFSLAHIWEPSQQHRPSPFLEMIPSKILHSQPQSDPKLARAKVKSICKCPGSCHERPMALWVKRLDIIRPIFHSALQNHLKSIPVGENQTVVRQKDMSTAKVGTVLPLIPDAAIHYRCGDNFVGHYGFLPFRAFSANIPSNISTLYVLAEQRERKTQHRPYLAAKCDALFPQLLKYLQEKFPSTTIVIRRGDDLHTDLARLTYARYVVCSVSTFCLWPAVSNQHSDNVHFPRSKLIVGGRTDVDLGFQWLSDPPVLLGKTVETLPPMQFVKQLTA